MLARRPPWPNLPRLTALTPACGCVRPRISPQNSFSSRKYSNSQPKGRRHAPHRRRDRSRTRRPRRRRGRERARTDTMPRVTVAGDRPVARRRPRRAARLRRAGGRERRHRTARSCRSTRRPTRSSAEASGRQAVQLAPGQYVDVHAHAAGQRDDRALRIPDAPTGGGIDAPLTVGVDHGGKQRNTHPQTITLTSQYSVALQPVSVHQRPERRRAAPRLVDRPSARACRTRRRRRRSFPTPFRPMHFYDEQRVLLGQDLPGGRHRAPDGAGRLRTPRGR